MVTFHLVLFLFVTIIILIYSDTIQKKIWRFPEIVGTSKSSILVGFSLMNQPFWGYHHLWKSPYIPKFSRVFWARQTTAMFGGIPSGAFTFASAFPDTLTSENPKQIMWWKQWQKPWGVFGNGWYHHHPPSIHGDLGGPVYYGLNRIREYLLRWT